MKFVALVSGGKDSIFSIMESQRQGHELVACVHLGRPLLRKQRQRQPPSSSLSSNDEDVVEEDDEEEESYMYQTAGSEVVKVLVEQCLQVPLILHVRQGTSVNTSLVYQHQHGDESTMVTDEVEDLYQALHKAKSDFPEIQAVSSGAILSTYQRVRIEHVCQRLGLVSLSFLWRRASQHDVLHEMISAPNSMHAVLVRTAAPPGLIPKKHLNGSIADLQQHFHALHAKYQFHVCGEGGEYETLCLDCPIYKKRLVLDQVQIHETDDGVGVLEILACHAEDKSCNNNDPYTTSVVKTAIVVEESPAKVREQQCTRSILSSSSTPPDAVQQLPRLCFYPHVRRMHGGLWHVSDIVSPTIAKSTASSHVEGEDEQQKESALAVQEAVQIFGILEALVRRFNCTPQDVVFVHLYLSQMSHFSAINPHFEKMFGVLLPPSRSCVAIPSSSRRRVQLDCLVQCGSGEYMRRRAASSSSVASLDNNKAETTTINPYTAAALTATSSASFYRDVLHVQSRSHWAPVCVGPYSQANTLYSAVHVLAGQIGLHSATMTLRCTWEEQLQQVWKNIASVLDALDSGASSLSNNLLSGLVYIADKIHRVDPAACIAKIYESSHGQIQDNGGVVPGAVDNMVVLPSSNFGGYEDEETMLEVMSAEEKEDYKTTSNNSSRRNTSPCPLLVVSIPEMPLGAHVEVEVVAASSKAASCLSIDNYSMTIDNTTSVSSPTTTNGSFNGWDTGHDFVDHHHAPTVCRVDSWVRSLGRGCAAYCLVTAAAIANKSGDRARGESDAQKVDAAGVIHSIVTTLSKSLEAGPSGLGMTSLLHIRFYYVLDRGIDEQNQTGFDLSAEIRSALQQVTTTRTRDGELIIPAISVIPVYSMSMLDMSSSCNAIRGEIFMAMQATLIEPTALETELWIRHSRG
jgi:diphthine-ammonia ligase